MQIIRSIKKMQHASHGLCKTGKSIGLVATMGFLHEGHLSLIKKMKKKTDVVITTIFVNPAQFSPNEDLKKYPRDEKGDIKKIKSAGGDIVFIPTIKEMYPENYQTYIEVEKLSKMLEGKHRPDHFKGVTTVVSKLFNITRPNAAIFGMKDFQQAIVLKKMTEDLGYPIKFYIAPTVRENDGLAMSSRNKYFNENQRKEAISLYYALRTARAMVLSQTIDVKKIRQEMKAVIKSICPTAKIEYIEFTDHSALYKVEKVVKNTVCSLAVELYGVRLIDNMRLF